MSQPQPPAATQVIDLTSGTSGAQLDRNRAAMMEFLYRLYQRDEAPLGLRCTYTGLMEQFRHDLAAGLVAHMEATWHQEDWGWDEILAAAGVTQPGSC